MNSDNGFLASVRGACSYICAYVLLLLQPVSLYGPKSPDQRTPAGAVPGPGHGPRGKCFETERDVGGGWLMLQLPFSTFTSNTYVSPFGMFRFVSMSVGTWSVHRLPAHLDSMPTGTSGQPAGAFRPPNAQQPSLPYRHLTIPTHEPPPIPSPTNQPTSQPASHASSCSLSLPSLHPSLHPSIQPTIPFLSNENAQESRPRGGGRN